MRDESHHDDEGHHTTSRESSSYPTEPAPEPQQATPEEMSTNDANDPTPSLLRSSLSNPDQLTAMLSNYSTSYNAVNVSIVLPLLKYSLSTSHSIQFDEEQDSIVASSLLAGMIFGQLFGGYLGDAVGRRNAMMMVMTLQIGGSLGGAFLSVGESALEQLALWRFVLGMGAGGVYPLAAVMSAENCNDEEDEMTCRSTTNNETTICRDAKMGYEPTLAEESLNDHDAKTTSDEEIRSFQRVALTFSMQGLGFITVPLLSYPMLALHWNIDLIWRLLLGLGAVPGLFVMYLRLFRQKEERKIIADSAKKEHRRSEIGSLELTQPTVEEESSSSAKEDAPASLQSTVSTLFNDMVEGDPSLHVDEDHQMALVDNSHLDDSDRYEGFDDPTSGFKDEPESNINEQRPSLWASIKDEPNLAAKLVGTAGTWFLFDVLFYGNTLFEPVVLEAAFGSKEDVEDGYTLLLMAVRDSLMISLLSLPGYFVTVMLIGKRTCVCQSLRSRSTSRCSGICSPCTQTPAFIQMQGFLVMFLLYLIIGLYWTSLSNIQWLLLLLYAGSFFFANYGPNSTTFLLPSVTYSKECRSTLNGISAAAGKFGALVGASAFEPAADRWGESVVMMVCAVFSLFGFCLTKGFVGKQNHECL
jgi:PHS family inorganic phosphate transporter-like MFS transporter